VSGGAWGYQSWHIKEDAERICVFLRAVAESEHIVDWAESGDTVRHDDEDGSGAERDLYDLWVKTFNEVYGGG
jgi:hypothetical protein